MALPDTAPDQIPEDTTRGILDLISTPDTPERHREILSSELRWAAGLICAVVQDAESGLVLMVGWMDPEALRRTLIEGRVTFFSRSRQEYWRKGDTSGHRQWVRDVLVECHRDALVISVIQEGAACHRGTRTCFVESLAPVQGHPENDTSPAPDAR